MSSRIVHSTQVLTRLPFSIPKALVEVRLVIVVYPFLWTEVVAYSQKHCCRSILKSRPLRIITVEFFKVTFMVVQNFWLTKFWLHFDFTFSWKNGRTTFLIDLASGRWPNNSEHSCLQDASVVWFSFRNRIFLDNRFPSKFFMSVSNFISTSVRAFINSAFFDVSIKEFHCTIFAFEQQTFRRNPILSNYCSAQKGLLCLL